MEDKTHPSVAGKRQVLSLLARFSTAGVRMKTVENGRKTPQPFSTFIFEYENKSKNGKAGHENERELTKYQEF
jgi:hypothetical protein